MFRTGGIPKIRMDDRIPMLYLEHAAIYLANSCVMYKDATSKQPCALHPAAYAVIMLGVGSSITHDAAIMIAGFNTIILWCSSEGLSIHTVSVGCTFDIKNAKQQVERITHDRFKLWNMLLDARGCSHIPSQSYKELLLVEASYMKHRYAEMAKKYGVNWNKRIPRIANMDKDDVLNKSITYCNMALYGIATSVIYGLGYLPQFGIIHGRGATPLAYDIADVFKLETSIPCAMRHVSQHKTMDYRILMTEFAEMCCDIPSKMVNLLQRLFNS